MTVPSPVAAQHTVHYDATAGKLVTTAAKAAKDGPVGVSGNFLFAGMEDAYFAAVSLPGDGSSEIETFNDKAPTPANPTPDQLAGVALGGAGVNRFPLFVGPKDLDILKQVNPKLEQVVDFGWFSFIAKPLFLVMHWLTDNYVKNYGWSIILMTVFINFALFPLKITSMKSMKKMQALQPQIAAINDKYKNVGMRDPKKQEQNQEVMALYQKHGVNPLGGCMPMALQMPFLFAFYKVFSIAIEMRGASWLWVTDLSQHETIPIHILPDPDDRDAIHHAEDDPDHRRRSGAAEDHDVHAAHLRVHVLQPIERSRTILVDWKPCEYRPAMVFQPHFAGVGCR